MRKPSSGRFESVATGTVALLSLAVGTMMVASPVWRVPREEHQLGMVEAWSRVAGDFAWTAAARIQPMLVASTALVAAGMVLALSLRPPGLASILRLRRALALGTPAALYFFHVRLLSTDVAAPVVAALDVSMFALAGWAISELAVFLGSFPQPPDLDRMRSQVRAGILPAGEPRDPGVARDPLPKRAYDRIARLLHRVGVDRAQGEAYGSEQYVERNAVRWQKMSRAIATPAFAYFMAGTGALAGLLFVLSESRPALDIAPLVISSLAVALPVLGIGGLALNYRLGSPDERRRIGWIYLGPAAGFLVSMGAFVVTTAWFLATMHQAASWPHPAHTVWGATTLLAVPAMFAGLVFGLAFSTFYTGSLDPRLAIRRGAVVALSGIVLTATFVALEGAITSQFVVRVGLPDHSGAILAGTLAAVAFAPVRRKVDALVDQVVDRLMPVGDTVDGEAVALSVCFVDLCGYTALSSRDQATAVLHASLLHKCGRAAAARLDGALVKTIGDAVMLRLPGPDAAIACVRRIAEDYRRGASALDIEPLPLHAGLHHGDVMVARDGDLFGTSVNLAARLLGAAGEEALLLSGEANARTTGSTTARHGKLSLKNIPGTVETYSVDLRA